MNECPKPIDVQKKLRWKNFYKFAGVIPNLSFFPKIKTKNVIELNESLTEIPRKRMWILILEYLSPKDLVQVVALLNKRFYALTWNPEVIKNCILNILGIIGYDEMCLRIANKFERQLKGKILNPYKIILEETSDESHSEFDSTSDEHEFTTRKSDSSTDAEQTLKEFIRREELKIRRIKRWENEVRITQMKLLYMRPQGKQIFTDEDKQKVDKHIDDKIDTIKDEIVRIKRKKVRKYIDENINFWRRILLYCSIAHWCTNWFYVHNKNDGKRAIIVIWPLIKKPLWYQCKNSEEFRMISATNAQYKYHIKKEYLERWNIKFMKAMNPYHGEGHMKLYYDYQVKQWLPIIEDLKKEDEKAKQQSIEDQRAKKLDITVARRRKQAIEKLTEELVYNRKTCASREEVIEKYINHPYMQRFFEKKLKRKLGEVVALINTGKATRLEEMANNRKRKKLEEQRLLENKKELLGSAKFEEYEWARNPSKEKKRKKKRQDKVKELKAIELERRKLKLSECDLLEDYYNNINGSDSDSSSASSINESPRKHKKKHEKHQKKNKKHKKHKKKHKNHKKSDSSD
jgi:hypothetical protein